VLEDHGWVIQRIWSTDWFLQPDRQLARVKAAIEAAQKAWAERAQEEQAPPTAIEVMLETETPDGVQREVLLHLDSEKPTAGATPYIEAVFEVPRMIEPHELSTKGMAEILLKVIAHESPIHEDELVNRVRDLWGLSRAGTRIQDAVARGVRSLLIAKQCAREDDCLLVPGAVVVVRNRAAAKSAGLKKPEMLPGPEIRAAIQMLIKMSHGAAKSELPSAVARLLGFKAAGSTLRSVVEYQTKKLLRVGAILEEGELLRNTEPGAEPPGRNCPFPL
jgi:hypothetical protein